MTDHDITPDDGFERWLASAAPSLNEPPATPRDAMWAGISSQLLAEGSLDYARDKSRQPRPHARRLRGSWMWPAAVAAALVGGIAIDRVVLRPTGAPAEPTTTAARRVAPTDSSLQVVATDPQPRPRPTVERRPDRAAPDATPPRVADRLAPPSGEARGPSATLRLAAAQTLAQAELLLAAYRTDDTADTQQLGRWAREVLASTRLLLDSRAARDPQLGMLLQDLELVLMQIAQLSGAPMDTTERELLDRMLRDRELLPRIRSAVPTTGAAATMGATTD